MSDIMIPMPISQLVKWVVKEKKEKGTVFGVYRPYTAASENNRKIFGRNLETAIGPAAGPHTQLAQNIVAAYYAGSRFFELKTVQIMDGAELAACVKKPCIKADDECYNVEWSTELYVPQAMGEYIKAWFMLHVMAKEFGLGSMDGFQFNLSVGYNLEGIQSEKIDTFLEGMKEAKDTAVFKECKQYLLDHIDMFDKLTKEDVESISSNICNSATLSTLHGCPPQEIERIANYLIDEKGMHTFIKCNPTLLGYEYARETMDRMGYDYVAFTDFHFLDDLQYEDAVPMLERLLKKCEAKGLEFGVKITNTFPVDVKQNELPGEEMYMSGRPLYPLSISVARKLAEDFDGKLRISYSGGADFHNIDGLVDAGIWPVTIATTLLKPGGYQRCVQIAEKIETINIEFTGVDKVKVAKLTEAAFTDVHHVKAVKPLPERKINKTVPLVNCFMAPCQEGCPIHQDITQYIELTEAKKYDEALNVILEKNPLPFITGTICPHNCMSKCTRNFYEEAVQIRGAKLTAAIKGYDTVISTLKAPVKTKGKVAIVGGGPAGIAAAHFLARAGVQVTIFEKRKTLGGVVRHIIPDFRIAEIAIEKDIEMIRALGVEIKVNTEVKNVQELRVAGYEQVIIAVGASTQGTLMLESGETMNALAFLEAFKKQKGEVAVGKNVVVIGGGNTAMDTARAAKRTKGVENVYLVYRRTKRYMPADEEELVMAVEDGVVFKELLAPKRLENGKLVCKVMELGEIDTSGRRGVNETTQMTEISADTVIVAVGEQVDEGFLKANNLEVTNRGKAKVNEFTLESSVQGVYVVGDGLGGPATVVEGIRDAQKAVTTILDKGSTKDYEIRKETESYYEKRGVLKEADTKADVDDRCLGCASVCENCAEACPNRANVSIKVSGLTQHQIIHVDTMCNECGNCKSFCPYASAPYLDKLTLFANEADMEDSKNQGFVVLDDSKIICKVRLNGSIFTWEKGQESKDVPAEIGMIMATVCADYRYLWC